MCADAEKHGGTNALSFLLPRGRHPPMAPRRFLLESDDESAERACEPPDTASPFYTALKLCRPFAGYPRETALFRPSILFDRVCANGLGLSVFGDDRGMETLIGRNCWEYLRDVWLTLFHIPVSIVVFFSGYTYSSGLLLHRDVCNLKLNSRSQLEFLCFQTREGNEITSSKSVTMKLFSRL